VLLDQVRRQRRVVLVVAEHDERAELRPNRPQQVDDEVNVGDLFADVAGDAHEVGLLAQTPQRRLLGVEQPQVAGAHVQVADVHDLDVRPVARQGQAMALEDGPVGLAEHGVSQQERKCCDDE
jgi:hypothetical protein